MTTSTLQSKPSNSYEKAIEVAAEVAQCAADPKHFLKKYAYIQTRTNPPKIIKWEPWNFQLDLIDFFLRHYDIVILKARQLGISWLLSGYCLWKALFHNSAKTMYVSQGEKEAWELLRKSHFIYDHLPDFLKAKLGRDTLEKLTFPSQYAEMEALPATAFAGQGTDASVVVRDEVAYHPEAQRSFVHIGPAIDAGGQGIDLSTNDPNNLETHFMERISRARDGSTERFLPSGLQVFEGGATGTLLIFLGWKLRPVRQEGLTLDEWFDLRVKPKYSDYDLAKLYPETIEQALEAPSSLAYFDVRALNKMLLYVLPFRDDIEAIDCHNGIIKIWQEPLAGERYIVFTDPSDGHDPFATIAKNIRTGEWVATAHGKREAEDCAVIHDSLVRYYNNAYNDGETNAKAGGKFALTIEKLNTPNRAPRRDEHGNIKLYKGNPIYGWYTAAHERDKFLSDYKEAVRKHLIIIHDREAIEEHRNFIRIDGKPQARGGCHDDFVMAGMGAWQLQKYVPTVSFKAVTILPKGG